MFIFITVIRFLVSSVESGLNEGTNLGLRFSVKKIFFYIHEDISLLTDNKSMFS